MSITHFNNENNKSQKYALIRRRDEFGVGYLVSMECYLDDAKRDGWEVVSDDMELATANRMCKIYRTAGVPPMAEAGFDTPDLSDLLTYDMTAPPEDRQGQVIEEFDLINVMLNGYWVEATVTAIEEDYIEIDGNWIVDRDGIQCELIAKAEDDCGFLIEYGEWLDTLNENHNRLFQAAVSATSALSAA